MRPRLAERLLALYPAAWRRRYAAEFLALLESEPAHIAVVIDVVFAAARERSEAVTRAVRTPPCAVAAWVGAATAAAAGANLYLTVDDASVARHGFSFSWPSLLWRTIELGSVGLALGVAVGAWSIVPWIARATRAGSTRGVWRDIVPPSLAFAALTGWVVVVLIASGGRWAASPWASDTHIAAVSRAWQMTSAAVTTILLVAVVTTTSTAGARVVAKATAFADVSRASALRPRIQLRVAVRLLAFSSALMLMSSLAWCAEAFRADPTWMRSGTGILGLPAGLSCLFSVVFMAIAAALALMAARRVDAEGLHASAAS